MRKKICLLFLLCAVACGGQQFDKTYGYVATSVNAAREGFLMWDQDHQQDIVTHAATREDGEAKLLAYRLSRKKVVLAFTVTYQALALAGTLRTHESILAAATQATQLYQTIKAFYLEVSNGRSEGR